MRRTRHCCLSQKKNKKNDDTDENVTDIVHTWFHPQTRKEKSTTYSVSLTEMMQWNEDSSSGRRIRLTFWRPKADPWNKQDQQQGADTDKEGKSTKLKPPSSRTSTTQPSSPVRGTQPTSNADSWKADSHQNSQKKLLVGTVEPCA